MISIYEYLQESGLNHIEAELWSEFVTAVLETLLRAERALNTPLEWARFRQKDGAFGKARRKGRLRGCRVPNEEALSLELADRMFEIFQEADASHFLKTLGVIFDCEPRLRTDTRTGKRCKRADIRARSSYRRDVVFILEAKVIETEQQLSTRLLGQDGMGCFTRMDPYCSSPVAGLLAYVVDDPPALWVKRLATALPKKRATRVAETTIPGGAPVVLACVPRKSRSAIAILGVASQFAVG